MAAHPTRASSDLSSSAAPAAGSPATSASSSGAAQASAGSWLAGPRARIAGWGWPRHWEFWLCLAVGAFLRLWHLEFAQILGDQVGYLSLARESVLRGAFPVNGLEFTVGIRSNPLDILLSLPFVIFSKNPFADELAIALFCVVGVGLCYIFAEHEWGRRVALIGTLLFATCGFVVDYARYLWQLSYQPTLLVLYGMTLYAGGIRGRRGWLVPNLVLIALMFFLHPTAVLLLPATLAAVLLGPRAPRWRDWLWAVGIIAILLVPTVVFELVSHGYDVQRLLHYASGGQAVINADVFHEAYLILGPPTDSYIGHGVAYAAVTANAPYHLIDWLQPWMRRGINVLYPVSWCVLTGFVLWPVRGALRASPPAAATTSWPRRLWAGTLSIWRGLRADAAWRGHVFLWLWVSVPIAALIRHTSAVHGHYFLIIYPAIFIMLAEALVWGIGVVPDIARRLAQDLGRGARMLGVVAQVALVAGIVFFIAGQTAQYVLYTASAARGDVDISGFGHPLGDVLAADATLRAMQRERGASAVYLSNPDPYFQSGLNYLLVREEPERTGFYGACLVLPPPDASSTLVVSTIARSPAAALLKTLPNATPVGEVHMNSGESFPVYQVSGALPQLPGETPLGQIRYVDAAGNGLRLDAETVVAPGVLRLRWTVLGSTPVHTLTPIYTLRASALSASGAPGAVLGSAECAPTRWQAGQTVFTWLAPPTLPTTNTPLAGTDPNWLHETVGIQVLRHTTDYSMYQVGPFKLISGVPDTTTPAALPPAMASGLQFGSFTAAGQFALPLGDLPPQSAEAPAAGTLATCMGMDSCYDG